MKFARYLNKTDYKTARECPTKLFYLRSKYPSKKESSEYLELLKEGGHIIGEMARVIHPTGIFVGLQDGFEKALEKTNLELEKENVTLFEAVVLHNNMLAVIDILEKKGSDVNLIEVKSKSYDSNEENSIIGKKGGIKADWQEYIEDVAFQSLILQSAKPIFSITPYLLLPDKTKTTKIDFLASFFHLEHIGREDSDYFRVHYTGDRAALIADNFLTRVNVTEAVKFLSPLVQQESNKFLEIINPELKKIQYHIGKHCKDCEFRKDDGINSGYHECWGDLADVKPHIFDLYFGGALKKSGKFLFDELISEKKVSLYDIPSEFIKDKRGQRQSIQISCTRENQEWINFAFKPVLESFSYPLHFIDFETSTSAVPYHKNMKPYEQIAFQWSSHTIASKGAEPKHQEWINVEDSFPSFKFAESLMKTISPNGTIFMWADHENRVLKDIRRQMQDYSYENPELANWIDSVVSTEESQGRLVDMNKLCLENYFHPQMKGKTSIKYTLPSVWNNNSYLWNKPFLKSYFKKSDMGAVLSPYELLPPMEIAGKNQQVKEGTSAMIAYQEMMYGLSKENPEIKEKWAKLLLQYCELDTLAMVIIFLHWSELLGVK